MKAVLRFGQQAFIQNLILFCLSIGFSFALLVARSYYSGTTYFSFLVWNLFLAFIPFALSSFIKLKKNLPLPFFLVLAFIWLLFFPNAPYILTDLFHLRTRPGSPLWFDLVVILSFAWNGLLLGFVSLADMQKEVKERFGPLSSSLFAVLSLFLGSFGIYLGRFLRWNSWDLLTQPLKLLQDIWIRFANPLDHPGAWGVTLIFSIFLGLCYLMLTQLSYATKDKSKGMG